LNNGTQFSNAEMTAYFKKNHDDDKLARMTLQQELTKGMTGNNNDCLYAINEVIEYAKAEGYQFGYGVIAEETNFKLPSLTPDTLMGFAIQESTKNSKETAIKSVAKECK
jgi:hypothetical protein